MLPPLRAARTLSHDQLVVRAHHVSTGPRSCEGGRAETRRRRRSRRSDIGARDGQRRGGGSWWDHMCALACGRATILQRRACAGTSTDGGHVETAECAHASTLLPDAVVLVLEDARNGDVVIPASSLFLELVGVEFFEDEGNCAAAEHRHTDTAWSTSLPRRALRRGAQRLRGRAGTPRP